MEDAYCFVAQIITRSNATHVRWAQSTRGRVKHDHLVLHKHACRIGDPVPATLDECWIGLKVVSVEAIHKRRFPKPSEKVCKAEPRHTIVQTRHTAQSDLSIECID